MGACASCLGRRHERPVPDEAEESRLLYDDDAGAGMQYGSFGEPPLGDDAVEAQRENEALQRVVARTSNNMVDAFDIAPHDLLARGGAPFAYAAHGARLARYQHLVARLGDDDGDAAGVKVDWLADADDDGHDGPDGPDGRPASVRTLNDDATGPLVGTFADAAAAMR